MSISAVWKLFAIACKILRWLTRLTPHRGIFLIVEDDPDDAWTLSRIINKRGWRCEIANSAEVAQGMVKHTQYAAVFIDLRLPGMSGTALVRLLSKDTPHTQLIIVCGEPSDLSSIPEGELVCLVKKPARLETLEAVLSKLKL